jgi:hypothetical protein
MINQLGLQVYRIKNAELKNLAAVTAKLPAFLDQSAESSYLPLSPAFKKAFSPGEGSSNQLPNST